MHKVPYSRKGILKYDTVTYTIRAKRLSMCLSRKLWMFILYFMLNINKSSEQKTSEKNVSPDVCNNYNMSHKMTNTTSVVLFFCYCCRSETKEQRNRLPLVPLFCYRMFFVLLFLWKFCPFGSFLCIERYITYKNFSSETKKLENYRKSIRKKCDANRQYLGVVAREWYRRKWIVYDLCIHKCNKLS